MCLHLLSHSCLQGIQALLQLSQPALLQLLVAAPSLAVAGPKAVEAQLQRVAWDLGLSAAGPEADLLLQVVPALGLDALLDHQVAAQRVRVVHEAARGRVNYAVVPPLGGALASGSTKADTTQ